MKRPVKIKQRDIMDCGAACLASIASFYNLNLPVSRIRQLASTDKKGTNVLGLIEAATQLGFEAKGVKGQFESLFKVPTPAIVHVIVKGTLHHYLVLYKITPKYVEVMDPGDGELHKYSHEEFKKIWTGVLVLLLPGQNFESGNTKISLATRFLSLVGSHKSIITQALFGALVYTLVGLTTSIYVQKIVDYVLVDGNRNLLNLMTVVMLGLLALQIFVGASKSIFILRTGQLIDAQLILGYYKHLLKLPQQFFDTMRVGEIISRINDAVKIRTFINDAAINIAVNLFIIILSFALMFTYYWKLALVVLLIIPIYTLIYFITNLINKKAERKVMENASELESQLIESLNSISTIKSFGLESYTNIKTETRFVSLLNSVYRSGLNSIYSAHSTELFSRLFTIILLWAGAGFVLDKEITPGELLSFYALIAYFTGPVSSLIGMNKAVQNALIAADRLFEIMDLEREKNENKIRLTKEIIGELSFKNVQFRYGSRVTVFNDLNLTIPKGKVTAVVGESGSGKSTLITILQNLHPIQNGSVALGEYDLKYIENESLRSLISVVPQKIDLFAGNVIENIAVGEYEPDIKKIILICTGLGIIDFIEKLPNGFNTYLGENGATLSGGQKQRIAIARALYKDPEILILDEATSALDSASEQYVHRMIDILRSNNKTVIIIAHRLSTIYMADKIVVLDKGKVTEEGSHEELLKNRGQYLRLWSQQFPSIDEAIKSKDHEHYSL
ncbi:peptidase domain-containing ABC transporter [Chryseosolibacter indicus]|uniref:Peptidase domain-containing ABC transporter n=1 Tax=Chryseosolibacter indicus TaxID=2782351 RepID=A0ABS5VV47_9BACT|nr:peptidase domain-containing ABC transporter [Chryseosolibacter indicus]MBT1705310.1 peptidase domain-containing ABC transporter [Chryseosolibacter indicus]